MVYRIYVEKKKDFASEAASLKNEITNLLQVKGQKNLRIVNRYDVENISERLFEDSIERVFSEPQVDDTAKELSYDAKDFVFDPAAGRRDPVPPHQVLGVDLAALDRRGPRVRAETAYPRSLQAIDQPHHQRVVGGYHGEVDGALPREGNQRVEVRRGYRYALGQHIEDRKSVV